MNPRLERIGPIGLTVLLLLLVLGIFEWTGLDLLIQDQLFDPIQKQWLVDRYDPLGKMIFYTAPKTLAILFGLCCLGLALRAWRRPHARQSFRTWLFLFLVMVLVPLIVASGKHLTNTFCPYQLARYGMDKPYVGLLTFYTDENRPVRPPRCFPAGHATAGFAFMALYFVLPVARRRWGLVGGLLAGWILGGYQMLKGAHFLSHTLVTMIASWLVILVLYRGIRPLPFTTKPRPKFLRGPGGDHPPRWGRGQSPRPPG